MGWDGSREICVDYAAIRSTPRYRSLDPRRRRGCEPVPCVDERRQRGRDQGARPKAYRGFVSPYGSTVAEAGAATPGVRLAHLRATPWPTDAPRPVRAGCNLRDREHGGIHLALTTPSCFLRARQASNTVVRSVTSGGDPNERSSTRSFSSTSSRSSPRSSREPTVLCPTSSRRSFGIFSAVGSWPTGQGTPRHRGRQARRCHRHPAALRSPAHGMRDDPPRPRALEERSMGSRRFLASTVCSARLGLLLNDRHVPNSTAALGT